MLYKSLKFKAKILGYNFRFNPPFRENLFSLKFSIGSYFTKMKAQVKIQHENMHASTLER